MTSFDAKIVKIGRLVSARGDDKEKQTKKKVTDKPVIFHPIPGGRLAEVGG
jgi:hypothetical protein